AVPRSQLVQEPRVGMAEDLDRPGQGGDVCPVERPGAAGLRSDRRVEVEADCDDGLAVAALLARKSIELRAADDRDAGLGVGGEGPIGGVVVRDQEQSDLALVAAAGVARMFARVALA